MKLILRITGIALLVAGGAGLIFTMPASSPWGASTSAWSRS